MLGPLAKSNSTESTPMKTALKIVVIGGSGLIGKQLGVNLLTGEGLAVSLEF